MKKIFPLSGIIMLLSFQLSAQNVGVGTNTPEATLDVNGDVIFRTADIAVPDGVTLALDVVTVKYSYYRVTGPTADFTIAGITAGVDGRLLTLFNRSGFTMQLNNEDVNAAATDQIMTGTNADVLIPHKGVINLQYDIIEQKWIVKSNSKGGSAGGAGPWDVNGNNIFNNNPGNVGIGISNPLSALHIKKDLEAIRIEGASPYIAFYNNSGTVPRVFMQNTGDNLYLGTSGGNTTGITQVYTNGTAIMTMTPTARVGIGTAAPADKLTVQAAGYGLTHTNGVATVGTWIGSFQGVSSAMIGTKSNHALNFFTANGISQMSLQTNGDVIIGANDVGTFGKLTVRTPNNSYGISHTSNEGNILATRIGGTSAGIGTFTNTHMRIFANGISAITITGSTANVGIGIEFPVNKFEVNGTMRSKEVIVEAINWPDYVFGKNYNLPSLSSIEKFIRENKHLPNIPSAAEIEKNGLHVGDTQKRMMEKIEELTLYVIGIQKEIDLLKKEKK